jgi:Flp pilus assembly pilin Flp
MNAIVVDGKEKRLMRDPRQAKKVEYALVNVLMVAVLCGADTFVEVEMWAKEKREWLRGYVELPNGKGNQPLLAEFLHRESPGAWTSSSPTTRCAPVPAMPPISAPSSNNSPSTSSASTPAPRKGGIKVQRLLASSSDPFHAQFLALA